MEDRDVDCHLITSQMLIFLQKVASSRDELARCLNGVTLEWIAMMVGVGQVVAVSQGRASEDGPGPSIKHGGMDG